MIEKKQWIHYGRKADSVEINVKDKHNQTIDYFKIEKGKTRDIKRIIIKIKEKYGFDLNAEEENEKKWLEKDMEW